MLSCNTRDINEIGNNLTLLGVHWNYIGILLICKTFQIKGLLRCLFAIMFSVSRTVFFFCLLAPWMSFLHSLQWSLNSLKETLLQPVLKSFITAFIIMKGWKINNQELRFQAWLNLQIILLSVTDNLGLEKMTQNWLFLFHDCSLAGNIRHLFEIFLLFIRISGFHLYITGISCKHQPRFFYYLYYISTQPFSTTCKHHYEIINQGNGKFLAHTLFEMPSLE